MLQLNLFHHCSFSSQESKEKPELHTVFVFKKSIVQLAKIFNYFKTKTKKNTSTTIHITWSQNLLMKFND